MAHRNWIQRLRSTFARTKQRRRAELRRMLAPEALEIRQLLAVDVSLGVQFSSDGTSFSDDLNFVPGEEIWVRVNYDSVGDSAATNAQVTLDLPAGVNLVPNSTRTALTPSATETLSNDDPGQSGPINESVVWSGSSLTIGPQAGLFGQASDAASSSVEIGKFRFINFHEGIYRFLTDRISVSAIPTAATVASNTADTVGNVAATAGAHILEEARVNAIDLLGNRFLNLHEVTYVSGGDEIHLSTGAGSGTGASNTNEQIAGTTPTVPGLAGYTEQSSVVQSFELLGNRYFNLHECHYFNGISERFFVIGDPAISGTNTSDTPDVIAACTAVIGGHALAGSVAQAIDTLDTSRGSGFVEFRIDTTGASGPVDLTAMLTDLSGNSEFAQQSDTGALTIPSDAFVVTTAVDENDGDPNPSNGTGTSLREAILAANANPNQSTITLDPALNGTPIQLTIAGTGEDAAATGDLDIATDVTITGNGATNTIIDAGGAGGLGDRVFDVRGGGTLQLSDSTVTGGSISGDGAGLNVATNGTTFISRSSISGNTATGVGGGVSARGNIAITDSTVSGNSAYTGGGLTFLPLGSDESFTLVNSTLSGNAGTIPEGIYINTFSGPTIQINNSTLNDGFYANGAATATIQNSIVFEGLGGGAPFAGGNNLVSSGSTRGLPNSIVGDPQLGPLQDNGGPTLTHFLAPTSPAVDAGDNTLAVDAAGDPLLTDQRGPGFDRILDGIVDMGAVEFAFNPPDVFVVDIAIDETDGDLSPGDVSLRDAIIAANADPNQSTIMFAPALDGTPIMLTIVGSEEHASATGDLDITSEITIQGNGAENTIIDAGGAGGINDRVIDVRGPIEATIRGVTITGGNPTTNNSSDQDGGGIRADNDSGLSITDSTITGNTSNGDGGGIYAYALTLRSSTVSNNESPRSGGGLQVTSGPTNISDSTISGNTASNSGGGLYLLTSPANITNSTISGNVGAGSGGLTVGYYSVGTITNSTITGNTGHGIYNHYYGTVTINNSIIAGNSGNDLNNTGGGTANGSHNLIQDGTGSGLANPVSGDPLLGPLEDNGGPTLTHSPGELSPAIDAGNDTLAVDADSDPLSNDQRGPGFDRIVGASVDIGAIEVNPPDSFVVDLATDEADGDLSAGDVSLRDAIIAANANPNPTTITFAPGLDMTALVLTLTGGNEDGALTGDLDITTEVIINGNGATNTLIDGGSDDVNGDRVFDVLSGGNLTLDGVTVTGGRATDFASGNHRGAGIRIHPSAPTTISNSTVSGNSAVSSGGGISSGSQNLTIVDSTISGNTGSNAGGLYNLYGHVELTRTRFENNEAAAGSGGAIVTIAAGSGNTLLIDDADFNNNTASNSGGAIFNQGDHVEITNSRFDGNVAGEEGGAIRTSGVAGLDTLIIRDSSFTNNTATNDRGGAISGFNDNINVTGSTLSGNQSRLPGGAIALEGGSLTVLNSTLSSNTATVGAGGIDAFAPSGPLNLSVTNSTLYRNAGTGGATISHFASNPAMINNSILAGCVAPPPSMELDGNFIGSNNIVEDGSGAGLTGTITGDPVLGPLQDNGGPTFTHALSSGSPAVDAGDNAALPPDANDLDGDNDTAEPIPFDQRGPGFDRVLGSSVDIGAFELNLPATLSIANQVNLFEDVDTSNDIKVADIVINDPDGGNNDLSLSGSNDVFFTLLGSELFLRAGASLDFETMPTIPVTVEVDDDAIPGAPDDSIDFVLQLLDVVEMPEVSVTVAGQDVEDRDDVSFGVVELNSVRPSLTFTVTNIGNGDLTLQPISLPSGFVLTSPNFSSGQIVAPSASVDFSVEMETTTAGEVSGRLSFANNDSNESLFEIDLLGGVLAAATNPTDLGGGKLLIDNGDAGFLSIGGWNDVPGHGFDNDAEAIAGGTGVQQSSWSFGNLTPGQFQVSATWLNGGDRSEQVPVTIREGIGGPVLANVTLNQKPAPVGPVEGGRPFQLLDLVNLAGDTLVVEISNAGTSQAVIADAILIEPFTPPPATPEITVRNSGAQIADGSNFNFNPVAAGSSAFQTFTVRNDGTADLLLQPITVSGAAFSLGSPNFAVDQPLAPGAEVSVTINLDTSTPGTFNGGLSLDNNDGDESPFDLALSATVNDPAMVEMIIDDGAPGFNLTGNWANVPGFGFQSDAKVITPNLSGTASWVFSGLAAGDFSVSATWLNGGDRASSVPYVIRDGVGGPILASVAVNQQVAPTGMVIGGRAFSELGSVTLTGDTLVVEVSNAGTDGAVIADSVRIEGTMPAPNAPEISVMDGAVTILDSGNVDLGTATEGAAQLTKVLTVHNTGTADLTLEPVTVSGTGFTLVSPNFTSGQILAPNATVDITIGLSTSSAGSFSGNVTFANNDGDENPFDFAVSGTITAAQAPGVAIIDNGDAGFSSNGGWTNVADFGFGDDALAGNGINGTESAQWEFTGLTAGDYDVAVTWLFGNDREAAVTYVIRDGIGGALLATVVVDQTQAPSGDVHGGRPFQLLDTVTITGDTLVVEVSTAGTTKTVIADAVRIEMQ